MPAPSKTTTAAKRKPPARKAAARPADARDGLSLADLARGILAKDIRSRAQDVRRLAEAVLAGVKPKKVKDDAGQDKAEGGKKKKKNKGKKKLAKIPGQQAKN